MRGDGEILLRREIAASGKGRVFINSQPATAAVLKLLAPELALIHAQSETLAGFDGTQQRLLLDRFAGISTEAVAAAYAAWRECADKLQSLESDEQERLRMADLWRFQSREIESAGAARWGRRPAGDREARAGQCGEALRGGDGRV